MQTVALHLYNQIISSMFVTYDNFSELIRKISPTYNFAAALKKLKPILRDNNISLGSKVKLVRPLVISIFLNACEL